MESFSIQSLINLLLLASVGFCNVVPPSAGGANSGAEVTHDEAHLESRVAPPDVHHDSAVNPVPRVGSADQIPCTETYNCTSKMGPDAICLGIHCSCNDESYYSESTHKCLREVTNLGAGCEEDMQCKRRLGTAVTCESHYCTCIPTAAVVNGQCWVQKRLSEPCDRNEECMGGDQSSCVDGTCVCILGYVNDPSNTKCLKKAHNLLDSCEEGIQCTESFGDGSECKNSKCTCLEQYHFKNNICMKNLILGQRCGANVEGQCFLKESFGIDHVECQEVCKCKGDRVPSSDNQKCLEKDSEDDGHGGAGSLQPVLITIVTVMLARMFSS